MAGGGGFGYPQQTGGPPRPAWENTNIQTPPGATQGNPTARPDFMGKGMFNQMAFNQTPWGQSQNPYGSFFNQQQQQPQYGQQQGMRQFGGGMGDPYGGGGGAGYGGRFGMQQQQPAYGQQRASNMMQMLQGGSRFGGQDRGNLLQSNMMGAFGGRQQQQPSRLQSLMGQRGQPFTGGYGGGGKGGGPQNYRFG